MIVIIMLSVPPLGFKSDGWKMIFKLHKSLAKVFPLKWEKSIVPHDSSSSTKTTPSKSRSSSNYVTRSQARRSSGDAEADARELVVPSPPVPSPPIPPVITVEVEDQHIQNTATFIGYNGHHDTSMLNDLLIDLELTYSNQTEADDVCSYDPELGHTTTQGEKCVKFST